MNKAVELYDEESRPVLACTVGIKYREGEEQKGMYAVLEPWPDGETIAQAVGELFRTLLSKGGTEHDRG